MPLPLSTVSRRTRTCRPDALKFYSDNTATTSNRVAVVTEDLFPTILFGYASEPLFARNCNPPVNRSLRLNQQSTTHTVKDDRKRRHQIADRRKLVLDNILLAAIVVGAASVICLCDGAPTPPPICRTTCRGKCGQSTASNESFPLELPTQELIDAIVDADTGAKLLVDNDRNETRYTTANVTSSTEEKGEERRRTRRQSYVERRTCSSRFQLEIVVIPASILMIPMALCSLLLCVFCCGPKDSRGKMPDKMFGLRFFNASKMSKKRQKNIAESEGDELEYGDDYVRRKNSKKTRFATNVKVYEVSQSSSRRQSAVIIPNNTVMTKGSTLLSVPPLPIIEHKNDDAEISKSSNKNVGSKIFENSTCKL